LAAFCDECGELKYGGTLEFGEFIDDLKADGWKIRKVEDECSTNARRAAMSERRWKS